jgi:hypothetical protein
MPRRIGRPVNAARSNGQRVRRSVERAQRARRAQERAENPERFDANERTKAYLVLIIVALAMGVTGMLTFLGFKTR